MGGWKMGWRVALVGLGAWLAPVASAQTSGGEPVQRVACTFSGMLEDVRGALKTGSPAYKKYVRERLKQAAKAMPPDALRVAVAQERDPEVLEELGVALATQASFTEDASQVKPLLDRALSDGDPKLRAAAVRGLRGVGSVEMMAKNGGEATYERLIRDSAPEVREAVVGNLVQEDAQVYFGHGREVSETAVAAALAARDPEAAAKLLSQVSMEQVSPGLVEQLTGQLRSEHPGLRAAAATALGGVPGVSSQSSRQALVELYRTDKDPAVRKAALEGIARLGLSGSRATLESLRGVAPGLDPEIDAWVTAMNRGLQEWHLLQREKQRLRK
jgi:hypothetical protein